MRILFTADIHINLNKKNVPYEWAISRYHALFENYLTIIKEHNIDLFIIGGDVFDKKPDFDELELYYELVYSLPVNTIIYDGNHEASKKGKTFFTKFKGVTSFINPLVSIIDEITTIYGVDIVPYNRLKDIDSAKHKNSNILCTHVRGNIPPHVKSEIDLERLGAWKVVLAGDLHSHTNSQENIVYPGSPVTVTFHRNEVDTGVIVLDYETLKYTFIKLHLPQLIRKRIGGEGEIVKTDFNHTIYEVEGNVSELAKVNNSELIDKKIIKRKFTPTLQLKDMTVSQEVEHYCKTILKLDDTTTNRVIDRHKEYIEK
jgi:DNA repair exonuclease SbcCD nuclease subunit